MLWKVNETRNSDVWGSLEVIWSNEGISSVTTPRSCFYLNTFRDKELNTISVQFSHSVVSDSSWPHGLEHVRPSCPLPTPRVYSNSCPLSQWCHPTISFSVVPFSSCLQSFPKSASFQMSQLFASGGQSTGVSASALVLPMNIQDWFPLGWTGWISLLSRGLSRVFPIPQLKTSILRHSAFIIVQLSHTYITTGKTIALTTQTFFSQGNVSAF